MIKLETTMGDIYIELDDEKAPKTSANFKRYVEEGFYNGTIFHRVIGNFMIQGGGMNSLMEQKATHEEIENEADNGLKNYKYTVAMARTNEPHSASSQFFINVKNNDFLNHKGKTMSGWGYAVFGRVVKGQDVVHNIEGVPTRDYMGHGDVPAIPVVIKSATVVAEESIQ
ncbi:MAG: peptidyl-prolyl cis-trans isomerase [Deltaproteobacteria bacterium]|nr:peptidyl-prolyl cis-trans isomerase [Deltaproteobacteria bacterium]